MAPINKPKVSVVIVNYRVKWFLTQTIASAVEALKDFDSEIWVVDNNSGDDSIAYAKSKFSNVKFIENTDNYGFAKANNQAIKLSSGEYTLILNPDTIVTKEAICAAVGHLDSNLECGAVGTRMIDATGKFLPESKRSFPTPWVSFCKIFGLQSMFPKSKLFARYALLYLPDNKPHRVDILSGAYIMARTEILKKIEGFDEDFFMYGEDIDLSYRIAQQGFYNQYLPTSIVHYKGESTHHDDFRYVKVFYQAMLIFYKKHYPNFSFAFGLFVRAGITLRASMAVMHRVAKRVLPFKRPKQIKSTPDIVLDDHDLTYSQIVQQIAQLNGTNTAGIKSNICDGTIITPKMQKGSSIN